MKPLLLWTLALLGAAGAARAQALRGGYRLDTPPWAFSGLSAIRFDNGRFEWITAGCVDRNVDKGRYSHVGNKLTLRYDNWQQPASTFTIVPATQADSSGFEVVALDAETGDSLDIGFTVYIPSQPACFDWQRHGRFIPSDGIFPRDADTVYVGRDCARKTGLSDYLSVAVTFGQLRGRCLVVSLARKQHHPAGGSVVEFTVRPASDGAVLLHYVGTDQTACYSRMSQAATRTLFHMAR